jgi:hypothetical protein
MTPIAKFSLPMSTTSDRVIDPRRREHGFDFRIRDVCRRRRSLRAQPQWNDQ